MVIRNSSPRPNRSDLLPNPQGQQGQSRGMLQSLLGDRMPRYNRFLDKMSQGSVIWKVPKDFGADEYNVVLGVGRTAIALGATATINLNAPRDLILRRLILTDALAPGNFDWTVTAISVEGNATVLGGALGGNLLALANLCPLEFDLPVAGGTPISIQVQNTGPAVGGIAIIGGFAID